MEKQNLRLGSLFDGSGGFPLAAMLCGIEPLWASEIEPFPIRVTTKRIPQMKHYGDISKLKGKDMPVVDIISFGSPCQDLSVAGARKGIHKGEQSNLFFEAIRIIKEMRYSTNGKYPRYAVWENVPGAFSSNKGADFKAVLESFVGIKETNATLPLPEKGQWAYSDILVGNGWSLAYRVIDAQYFGVPQRRRRIFLVADFASECAGKILFESEGLSRNFKPSKEAWERLTGDIRESTEFAGESAKLNDMAVFENHSQDTRYKGPLSTAPTVSATYGLGGNNQPFVTQSSGFCTEHSAKSRGVGYEKECSPTLRAGVVPGAVISFEPGATSRLGNAYINEDISSTLRANMGDNQVAVALDTTKHSNNEELGCSSKAYGICSDKSNSMLSSNPKSGIYKADTSRTLDLNGGNPSCNQGGIAIVEPIPFTQNQRDEVRSLGDKSAALNASVGSKQQTFVLQGSVIGRKDENGPRGDGINEDVSFTLNTTDKHGVVYAIDRESYNCGQNFARKMGISEDGVNSTLNAQGPSAVATPIYSSSKASFFTKAEKELANTLVATDYKDPPFINSSNKSEYVVRRLTPTECGRLQGFPDFWCADLGIEHPTEEDILFWSDVWETHRQITGKPKNPKTRKAILKWLRNPQSDTAEYKMWGNGVALPCVCFVLSGIVLSTQNDM